MKATPTITVTEIPSTRARVSCTGACIVALTLLSCSAENVRPFAGWTGGSSSIVVLEDAVWLTSPDDDLVVQVAASDLAFRVSVPVAGEPTHVASARGMLVVTLAQSSEVAVINTRTQDVTRVAVPCGGTRAVVQLEKDEPLLAVSCPNDDRVVILDVVARTVRGYVETSGRPTALAVVGDVLAVSASRLGRIRTFEVQAFIAAARTTHEVVPREDAALSTVTGVAASQVDAIAVSSAGGFIATYQRVEHDADRSRPPAKGGYGNASDGEPRLEPKLLSSCGGRYARFLGGAEVFSGPTALVATRDDRVLVVNQYTDNVAVLACASSGTRIESLVARGGERVAWQTTYRVGRGPRGIALSADGRSVFVDVGFDYAVARIDLTAAQGPAVRDVQDVQRRSVGATALSARALSGRNLFHDAVNTHLTPSGIVTCASCHPGGREDGLSWFLHTSRVGPKLRRTPPAWGARASLAPYHWDAEFSSADSLTRSTIEDLMQGDGLLVDIEAISAWMSEVRPPPRRPAAPEQRDAVAQGQSLFMSLGCSGCHREAGATDGMRHSVLSVSPDSAAELTQVDTPSLTSVRARAPYLHDGRAPTLNDVLTTHNTSDLHGATSALAASEINALVTYLETL